MSSLCSALPYDLRLGVTGHRRLVDTPSLSRAVDRLFDELARTLDGASVPPVSWTLISPLAMGADCIVARAALERLQATLEVVMPLPAAEYRRDFVEPVDFALFEDLLSRASHVEEPAQPFEPGPGAADRHLARDYAYLRVGQRVVDACEILIAVWDGRSGTGIGGTAEVIRYALSQNRVILWINAEAPGKPAVVLRAARFVENQAGIAVAVDTAPLPATVKGLSLGCHQQAAYCADRARDPSDIKAACDAEVRRLIEAARAAGIPAEILQKIIKHIVPHFVRADLLALHYQRRHARSMKSVLYLGALALTLGLAQAVFFPESLWLTGLKVLCMSALLALWLYGRRQNWHGKWLNDRCLAERLRSAMFVSLAGPVVFAPSRESLPFYQGPSQWIGGVAASLSAFASRSESLPVGTRALGKFLLQAWIEDQTRFNRDTAIRKAAAAHFRHRLEFGLIGGTFLMACLHWAGVGHVETALPLILRPQSWITFLALAFLPWAGAVHAVTSQLELDRVGQRADRMARNLDRIAPRVAAAATPAELSHVAQDATELLTSETHEWWQLLSFQEARLHA